MTELAKTIKEDGQIHRAISNYLVETYQSLPNFTDVGGESYESIKDFAAWVKDCADFAVQLSNQEES